FLPVSFGLLFSSPCASLATNRIHLHHPIHIHIHHVEEAWSSIGPVASSQLRLDSAEGVHAILQYLSSFSCKTEIHLGRCWSDHDWSLCILHVHAEIRPR